MDTTLRDAPERGRYELLRDDEVIAVADYRLEGDVVVIPHTEVRRDLRGQGIGARLVEEVLHAVLGMGKRVDPQCWYVAEYLDARPELAAALRV